MENNRRVVVTLALVAVIAVAAIGIGYAYTASTSNTGNDTDIGYYKLGAKVGGSAAISTLADDYKDAYSGSIGFNTVTDSTGTTVSVDGVTITALENTVAKFGTTTLIAFDQDDQPITTTDTDKLYIKLLLEIENPSSTAHNVNENVSLIAKLGNNFDVSDKENNGTSVYNGYTLLTKTGETYSGYLYVPKDDISAGFTIVLGGYLADSITAATLADTDMAFDPPQADGANDKMALYNATVKFTIASDGWI